MSATPSPSVEGTQAPSQIELLWERYRSLAYVLVAAVLGALAINYGYNYYTQKEKDDTWGKVVTSIGLDTAYTDQAKADSSVTEQLAGIELVKLRETLASSPEGVKPFILAAIARKSILEKDLDGAEAALKELETGYPNHSLVKPTSYPVQAREPEKDVDPPAKPPQSRPKETKYKPKVEGSAVTLMRTQIAAARGFVTPAQFAKTPVPADATKVKYEFGTYGAVVIALMPDAPKHREAILKLAEATPPFWVGLAVDEIHRPSKGGNQPHEMHFGFESTKEDDRAKWTDTEPSKNPVEFETNSLSHFAGAVSARNEADGKSCADRLWITVDDAPQNDGDRVIVGYVVEGLENVKRICEATMTAQEEEQGRGKPSETIRVTAVTVIR
jgi:cyclophilin family peptidyl-prolyl cis-trans isomerase